MSEHEPAEFQFKALKELFEARLLAIEKAIDVAKELMEIRLDTMNHFRERLDNQTHEFVKLTDYNYRHDRMMGDVRELRESKAMLEGKASATSVGIATFIAVIGLIVSIISIVHKFN
jgi:hypothetical protein